MCRPEAWWTRPGSTTTQAAGWFAFSDVKLVINQDNFPLDDRLLPDFRKNNCTADALRPMAPACRSCCATTGTIAVVSHQPRTVYRCRLVFLIVGHRPIRASAQHREPDDGSANLDWQATAKNRVQNRRRLRAGRSKNYGSSFTNLIFSDVDYYKPYPSAVRDRPPHLAERWSWTSACATTGCTRV